MLSYTFKRGFLQWVLDGKEYSLYELKVLDYCLTYWDWKSLEAEINKSSDSTFKKVMIHNLKLIYQFTFK